MNSLAWPQFPFGFYPVAIVAILLSGISKGGFGAGGAGVAVPLMSIFVAPPEAAAIMLPILCAMDLFGVHAYRGRWSRKHLAVLLPGAVMGIGLGAIAFGTLPLNAIRVLLGLIAVVFTINRWFRLTERMAAAMRAKRAPPGRFAGAFWGAVSGFTSTLAHAGGPPFAVYMLAQEIDKTLLVGTSVVFFFVTNYVKLVPYYWLGQLNMNNLAVSLLFAPLAPLGIWIGVWLHRRISQAAFFQVMYTLLFLTGAKLLWDGLVH